MKNYFLLIYSQFCRSHHCISHSNNTSGATDPCSCQSYQKPFAYLFSSIVVNMEKALNSKWTLWYEERSKEITYLRPTALLLLFEQWRSMGRTTKTNLHHFYRQRVLGGHEQYQACLPVARQLYIPSLQGMTLLPSPRLSFSCLGRHYSFLGGSCQQQWWCLGMSESLHFGHQQRITIRSKDIQIQDKWLTLVF